MYEKLSPGGMKVTKVSDGKLDGTVTAAEDGVLFTTIPYDKGWSVTVDGEKVETLAAGETFLAVRLSAGTHEIQMRYISPGFLPGLAISLVCWAFFFFLCVIWRVRRKRREAAQLAAAEAAGSMTDRSEYGFAEDTFAFESEGTAFGDDLSDTGSGEREEKDAVTEETDGPDSADELDVFEEETADEPDDFEEEETTDEPDDFEEEETADEPDHFDETDDHDES
jgi:hypothetical protein